LQNANAAIRAVIASSNNLYDQIQITNATSAADGAISLGARHYDTFYDISVVNSGSLMRIDGLDHTVFNRIFASNLAGWGLSLQTSSGAVTFNTVSQLTIAGMVGNVIINQGPTNTSNTFTHMTLLNASSGISEANSNHNTYSDIVIGNIANTADYIDLNTVTNTSLYDLTLQASPGGVGNNGINNVGNTSSTVTLDGNVRVKSNFTNCSNTVGTFQLNAACNYGPGLAKTAITSGFDLSTSFMGLVSSDPNNYSSSGGLGLQTYSVAPSTVMDWLNFLDPIYRGFALEGTGFFNDPSRQGPCTAGTTCRMYDTRLSASDPYLLNTYGNWNTSLPNCPSSVDGAGNSYPGGGPNPTIIVDGAGRTYLKNAVEIQFDDAPGANNNGLCESGEKCIYAPDAGAYQGEGDFTTQTCIFHNGTITNVTMYAYPINGD